MDLYHAGENELLKIVRSQKNSLESLMLFGHNPGFTWFANSLTGNYIDNVPTAGIVAVSFDCDDWNDVDFGTGNLVFFDYPKKSDTN